MSTPNTGPSEANAWYGVAFAALALVCTWLSLEFWHQREFSASVAIGFLAIVSLVGTLLGVFS